MDTTLTGGHTIYNSYHKRQQYAASRFRITTSNNWRSDGWNVNNGYFFFCKAIITGLEPSTSLWTGTKLSMSSLASWSQNNSSRLVIIRTPFEHFLSSGQGDAVTCRKTTQNQLSNNEKWYIEESGGKYKFLNYANNTRYIGKRETPGTNVSVDYQHLDVEVLEAESDYILVRLIGTYPSTYPFNDTNKSRTGNQKYYLGEYMRADDTTYNSYNEPWPWQYTTNYYYFGADSAFVDNPKWSGKNSDSWSGSNSYSNYVKYDKYRYTDNKPLGTVLRIEPQGNV